MRRLKLLLFWAGFLVILSGCNLLYVFSEVDAFQLELENAYQHPVIWDNIIDKPDCFLGYKPQIKYHKNKYVVRMTPGQSIRFKMPGRAALRILPIDNYDPEFYLDVSYSNGSGIYTQCFPVLHGDNGARFYKPDLNYPGIMRIQHNGVYNHPLELAVFISAVERLRNPAPYSQPALPDAEPIQIRRDDRFDSEEFYRLEPDIPLHFSLDQLLRISIETYLPYQEDMIEPSQPYRLSVQNNNNVIATMDFDTNTDTRYSYLVNDQIRVLGQLRKGFLTIPSGMDAIELNANRALFVRVSGITEKDYLFPNLNQPILAAEKVFSLLSNPPQQTNQLDFYGTITGLLNKAIEPAMLPGLQSASRGVLHDNSRRDSGLSSAALYRKAASHLPFADELLDQAISIESRNTFYRELSPDNSHQSIHFSHAYYIPKRLKNWDSLPYGGSLYEPQLQQWIKRLHLGRFIELKKNDGEPFEYAIPSLPVPSQLRVAVLSHENNLAKHRLLIQLDDVPPQRLDLIAEVSLSDDDFEISPIGESLAILNRMNPNYRGASLSGGFSRFDPPAQLSEVHYTEIPLPANTQTVKLWRDDEIQDNLHVSLAYRASKPFQLPEGEYLHHMDQLSPDFFTKLTEIDIYKTSLELSCNTEDEQQIYNHWLPFLRYLSKSAITLSASVEPPIRSKVNKNDEYTALQATQLYDLALEHEKTEQWITALSYWNSLLHGTESSSESHRQEALLGRARILEHLGEFFLAKQQYRGIWSYENDPQFRKKAFQKLLDLRRGENDWNGVVQLYAAALYDDPSCENYTELAKALLQDDKPEFAFLAAHAAAMMGDASETLLETALKIQWFRIFDRVAQTIASPKRKAYWSGRKALALGQMTETKRLLLQSDNQGSMLADDIEEQERIAAGLSSQEVDQRLQSIQQWQKDWNSSPANKEWRSADTLINTSAGAGRLYNIDRDLFIHGYFANSDQPVIYEAQGPITLQLEIRPLYLSQPDTPLNDWIMIKTGDQIQRIPITNNMPNNAMRLISSEEQLVGNYVDAVIEIEQGRHRIEINALHSELFVRAAYRAPRHPLGILPPITPQTIEAAISGKYVPSPLDATDSMNFTISLIPASATDSISLLNIYSPLTYSSQLNIQAFSSKKLENFLILHEKSSNKDIDPSIVLRNFVEEKKDAIQRMTDLLWIAEQFPQYKFHAQMLGEKLYWENKHIPNMQSLYTRLTSNLSWERITSVEHNAGSHFEETSGWMPESPTLQVRKNLIQPLLKDEEVIFGDKSLGLYMLNHNPTDIQIDFSLQVPDYLPVLPMNIAYQIDDGQENTIELNQESPSARIQVTIPTGEHAFRCWTLNPVVNQYVVVKKTYVNHPGEEQTISPDSLVPTNQRFYHVATATEPIELNIQGPTWLRIDELQGTTTILKYRYVEEGLQKVYIKPESDREEGFYRIFNRTPNEIKPEASPNLIEKEAIPVSETLVQLDEYPEELLEKQWLSGPVEERYNGTWSLTTEGRRRRIIEEDFERNADFDDYIETNVAYRYYHEPWNTFFQNEVLTRYRSPGGPTLGLIEEIRYAPDWTPWTFNYGGELYVQDIDDTSNSSREDLEMSAVLRMGVSRSIELSPTLRHTPRLSFFSRHLSLNPSSAFGLQQLDQDIYTPYKQQHQNGFRISDTLRYRPWQDSEWWTIGGLATNELFKSQQPDHLYFKTGWKQRLRNTEISTTFHLNHFLNDDDRKSTTTRKAISLDLLHDFWMGKRKRIELGGSVRYDIDNKDATANIFLTWHFGSARAYRDFKPGELDFMDLRERCMPLFIEE